MTYKKHLIIPDTQVKPGVKLGHLEAAGNYIVEKQPDVIVHLGDHWDMPSLSSYDEGLEGFDQRDYHEDIHAGSLGMELLLGPLEAYNKGRKKQYIPKMVFLMGNHEFRVNRFTEKANQARFRSVVSTEDFYLDPWKVYPFLKPVTIDGIVYCHYFQVPSTGRAYGGNAHYKLTKLKFSYVMGHVQIKDSAQEYLANGKVIRGLQAGAFYQHEERYLGHQGNHHWRGLHVLHEVHRGNYDHMEVSLKFLLGRYL
jgi:hypothetical protein